MFIVYADNGGYRGALFVTESEKIAKEFTEVANEQVAEALKIESLNLSPSEYYNKIADIMKLTPQYFADKYLRFYYEEIEVR